LTLPGLSRYCHLVAGIVGEVSARIFGQSDAQRTTRLCAQAGPGFPADQHHPRRGRRRPCAGRIYLPVNELQQFDVKAHEILQAGATQPRFVALMRFQRSARMRYYDEALALLPEA
jgi:phytoene synthase